LPCSRGSRASRAASHAHSSLVYGVAFRISGLGFEVRVQGFGGLGLGLGVWGWGWGFGVWDSGFRVWGLGFGVSGFAFGLQPGVWSGVQYSEGGIRDLKFRVWELAFGVRCLGCGVQGRGFCCGVSRLAFGVRGRPRNRMWPPPPASPHAFLTWKSHLFFTRGFLARKRSLPAPAVREFIDYTTSMIAD